VFHCTTVVGRDRDRRYSGGQALTPLRQRGTRSSRDLLHGDDMEAVMADALVSWTCSMAYYCIIKREN